MAAVLVPEAEGRRGAKQALSAQTALSPSLGPAMLPKGALGAGEVWGKLGRSLSGGDYASRVRLLGFRTCRRGTQSFLLPVATPKRGHPLQISPILSADLRVRR